MVQPFLLESSGLRGHLVRLGPVVDEIVTRHAYPGPVAALLAEMLALAATLSSMMKYDGVFTLQTKGDGPVKMLVADATSQGHVRGYAGFDTARMPGQAEPSISGLLGQGYLAFTVDQGEHTERYQGIVELSGESLADCVQHYFRQSEQIRTGLTVAAARVDGAWRAAGLILQRTPGPDAAADEESEAAREDWRRAMILQATCASDELLDPNLRIDDLLYRLFHEEGVRVFRRRGFVARCRCSRARLEETLRALPRADVEDMRQDGEVVMTCQFCNADYRFDDAALARLYSS